MNMTDAEAYRLGLHDSQKGRYPLYSLLLAAQLKTQAERYRVAWEKNVGQDLRVFRDTTR